MCNESTLPTNAEGNFRLIVDIVDAEDEARSHLILRIFGDSKLAYQKLFEIFGRLAAKEGLAVHFECLDFLTLRDITYVRCLSIGGDPGITLDSSRGVEWFMSREYWCWVQELTAPFAEKYESDRAQWLFGPNSGIPCKKRAAPILSVLISSSQVGTW